MAKGKKAEQEQKQEIPVESAVDTPTVSEEAVVETKTETPTVSEVEINASNSMVIGSGSMQIISSSFVESKDESLVDVLIKYPASWDKPKHMIEGKVYPVSPETAELLIAKGIATKV